MSADNEINTKITATTDGFDANVKRAARGVDELGDSLKRFLAAEDEATSSTEAISARTREASGHMQGLSFATAGATREIIVLAHEVVQGNFSRIPGSLMVLGERMGGLSLGTLGTAAAFAAAGYAGYQLVASVERSEHYFAQFQNSLALTGRAQYYTEASAQSLAQTLSHLHGVSLAAGREMALSLARNARLSGDDMNFLTQNVGKFATITGVDVPQALKTLAGALSDPLGQYKRLDEEYGLLSASERQEMRDALAANDAHKAKSVVLAALTERLNGVTVETTDLEKATKRLGTSWNDMMEGVGDSGPWHMLTGAVAGLVDVFAALLDEINKLASNGDLFTKLFSAIPAVPMVAGALKVGSLGYDALTASSAGPPVPKRKPIIPATSDPNSSDKRGNSLATQAQHNASADIAEERRVENEKYQVRAEYIRLAAEQKQISLSEEYTSLQAELAEEHNAEQKSYQDQLALWQQGSRDYQKILHEMQAADAKYNLDKTRLTLQGNKEIERLHQKELQDWQNKIRPFEHAFSSAITGMITGTTTLNQAITGMANAVISSFVNMGVQMAATWLMTEILGVASSETTALAAITASSGEAFAAAYASTCAIPVIGPELAPEVAAGAAAAAKAGGIAAAALPSAAGGWEVPYDTLAMVHKDEKILPASVSAKIDHWTGNGGVQTASGPTNITINATDSKSIQRLLQGNGGVLGRELARQVRRGNTSLVRARI